jgi:glutamate-1-semialdehyde 2,1-aminomutase
MRTAVLALAGLGAASAFAPNAAFFQAPSSKGRMALRGGAINLKASSAAAPTHVTTKSAEIMEEARKIMPGGVSSPVRAFKSVGGGPIVFDKVKDQYAFDVDGNKYIDYVGTWGPAICGHCNDEVNAELVKALEKGTSFGAPSLNENVLAKMVIDAVPSVEMVRFTNSGTEACMGMLRLVRAYTGREKIIKFEGCYHGHADGFLVSAGSGVITLGLPDSPGVPKGAAAGTLTAQYNDLASVEALVKANAAEGIAAIVLEPVVGNSGFIPPTKEFLQGLRKICDDNKIVLVFDEVMTGFRISYGGAQKYFGVTPDVTTMGKVIGGGLPVGAYGESSGDVRLQARVRLRKRCALPSLCLTWLYVTSGHSGRRVCLGAGSAASRCCCTRRLARRRSASGSRPPHATPQPPSLLHVQKTGIC